MIDWLHHKIAPCSSLKQESLYWFWGIAIRKILRNDDAYLYLKKQEYVLGRDSSKWFYFVILKTLNIFFMKLKITTIP